MATMTDTEAHNIGCYVRLGEAYRQLLLAALNEKQAAEATAGIKHVQGELRRLGYPVGLLQSQS